LAVTNFKTQSGNIQTHTRVCDMMADNLTSTGNRKA